MKLEKIRVLGTNINSYIDKFYENPKPYLNFDGLYSQSKFNDSIEMLLCFGLIEPEFSQVFSAKNQFKNSSFRDRKIERDMIGQEFIKTLEAGEVYSGQAITLYNICLSNLCYSIEDEKFDDEIIDELSVLVKSEFDKNAAKFWIFPEIMSIDVKIAMQKYVGSISKFTNKKMNSKYFNYIHDNDFQKIRAQDDVAGNIQAKAYNINMLITDIGAKEYHIPIYQRNYVWNEDSIERLLTDIMENNYINLNNVTFHSSNDIHSTRYEIIDGQQRLTTLFLILIALHRYLNSYFSEFDGQWLSDNKELLAINQYIYRNLFEEEKLKTNFARIEGNVDYSAFQELISGEECTLESKTSQVYKNYVKTYEMLTKLNKEELKSFANKFLNNVVFIITIDCESDEFTLFENLNTTSIPLSTIDLIKSYMLSLIKDEIEDKEIRFQQAFDQKIIKELKNKNSAVKIDNFMRVYIRAFSQNLDSKKTLLEQYKNIHNIPKASLGFNEVTKLLDQLTEKLKMYKYVTKKTYVSNIEGLSGLKIEDFTETIGERDIYVPIMIRMCDKYIQGDLNSNEVRELLFELERFEVIFKICSYRGQSLSKVMDKVLYKLTESDDYTVDNLRKILMEDQLIKNTLSISKKSFGAKFDEFEFTAQISKIVLTRVTNYLKNNRKITLNKSDAVRRIENASIEHIMPMNGNKWIEEKVVTENEHQSLVNKIGNHLLLENSLNSTIKDKLFIEKIEKIKIQTHMEDDLTYRRGQDAIGFEIKELKEYNAKTIQDRQRFLRRLAVEIWR